MRYLIAAIVGGSCSTILVQGLIRGEVSALLAIPVFLIFVRVVERKSLEG